MGAGYPGGTSRKLLHENSRDAGDPLRIIRGESSMAKERKIEGVLVAKVVEAVLDRTLAEKKLGGAGPLEQRIERLAKHILATYDETNQLQCTKCKAVQDLSYPRCPFCGVSGLQDAGPQRDWRTIEYHPAALIFPAASEEEMASLVESIRGGYDERHPIILYQGQILDGRNRHAACIETDVEPAFVELPEDSDPFAASWAYNGARRSLQPDVRTACFIKIAEASEGWKKRNRKTRKHRDDGTFAPSEMTCDMVAERAGVGLRTVTRVNELRRLDPEAFDRVAAGATSAKGELRKIKKAQEEAERKIREAANDLEEEPAPIEDRISVALMYRVNQVPLYARPKGRAGQEAELVPATTLVEDPVGELELSNGVVLTFALMRNGAGELILNVEPRRLAEEQDEGESGFFRTAARVA